MTATPSPKAHKPTQKRAIRLGLLSKILLSIVLAGALPLVIISLNAFEGYTQASDQATDIAKEALDQKSVGALRLQAAAAASKVKEILESSVDDTLAVASLPRQPQAYLGFSASHVRQISYPVFGSVSNVNTRLIWEPIYREIAYIDANGLEQLRIVQGALLPASELRDVSQPSQTTYKNEDYFARTASLQAGDIYVSPVMAYHTSTSLQPSNAIKNEPVGYAFSAYEAVIRFATPVFTSEGAFDGIVLLSLDHRHIVEQVVHIQPLEYQPLAWADYNSGDYAFMFDFAGYTIAHPLLYRQRGLNTENKLEAYTPDMSTDDKDQRAFNMQFSSKDTNFAKIYADVLEKKLDYAILENDKGVRIVRAYAPVLFEYGVYKESGIFGGVLIGASLNRFNQAADSVGQSIRNQQAQLTRTLLIILGIAIALMLAIAFILARGITTPILHLTEAAQEMEKGEYDPKKLEAIGRQPFQDEVSFLSGVFATMAQAVQMREKQLKDQVQNLLIQIDQSKKEQQVKEIVETEYFADLQRNAANLRSRARRASSTASPTEPLNDNS